MCLGPLTTPVLSQCVAMFDENMKALYETAHEKDPKGGWEFTDSRGRNELGHKDNVFLLCVDSGTSTVQAFAALRFEARLVEGAIDSVDSPCCYLYEMQVHKDHQGRGLGSVLIEALFDLIRHLRVGSMRVGLTVFKHNDKAVGFYLKKGFSFHKHSPKKDDGAAHYIMFRSTK